MRQHSVIDVFAGLAVCAVVYPLVYHWKPRKKKKSAEVEAKAEEKETISVS